MGVWSVETSIDMSDVVDPELWRDNYAWGTALGTPIGINGLTLPGAERLSGEERSSLVKHIGNLPDHVIHYHLCTSLSDLSLKLDMQVKPTRVLGDPVDTGLIVGLDYDTVLPRIQWSRQDVQSYYRIEVPGPIWSVSRVRCFFAGTQSWELLAGDNRIQIIDRKQGIIQLVPLGGVAGGSIPGGLWMYGTNGYVEPVFSLRNGFSNVEVPGAWAVDYVRGPIAEDGSRGRLELVLADWVGLHAARKLITLAVAPVSSIGSSSQSIDGVSQSVGLTSSATTTINSGIEYLFSKVEKDIDWEHMRAVKGGMPVMWW